MFSRHPRGNPSWPDMGIFAQRNKDRPNSIGLCTVELVEHAGRILVITDERVLIAEGRAANIRDVVTTGLRA